MNRLLAPIASIVLLTGPGWAAAAAGDVVLVPTSGGLGAEMPDIAARITVAVTTIAGENGLKPKVTDASRDDVFAVAGCNSDDDPCHQAVLRTLGAKKLILIHIAPGTGTTTAEVEIVVATRGKAPSKLTLQLAGTTTEALIAEVNAKAPPVFGGLAKAPEVPTTGGTDPVDPIDHGAGAIEDAPFSGEGSGQPISPFDEPTQPVVDPAAGGSFVPGAEPGADRGGYDFSRVGGTAWAVTGAGTGLVLTSFVFYALAGSKQDQVNSARVNTPADIERLKDLESSGKTLNNVANTTFLLGLVGLGIGGYLVYRDAKVPAGEASTVAISPALIGDGIGVGVVVRR